MYTGAVAVPGIPVLGSGVAGNPVAEVKEILQGLKAAMTKLLQENV